VVLNLVGGTESRRFYNGIHRALHSWITNVFFSSYSLTNPQITEPDESETTRYPLSSVGFFHKWHTITYPCRQCIQISACKTRIIGVRPALVCSKDDGILQFQGPSKQDSQSLDCYFEIVYQPTHVVGLHLNAWAFWPTTDSLSCGGEQQLWHELCDEAPHLFSPSTNLILWSRLHSSLYDLHGIASQMVVTHKSEFG